MPIQPAGRTIEDYYHAYKSATGKDVIVRDFGLAILAVLMIVLGEAAPSPQGVPYFAAALVFACALVCRCVNRLLP